MNPLKKLTEFGQSVYLDEISRSMLQDGTLRRLISEDGIHGVTSNPAIFEKAIASSDDYAEDIRRLAADRKSTRLNSSHVAISYAVFCLKKKSICGVVV